MSRTSRLHVVAATIIQSIARMSIAQKHLNISVAAATIIQKHVRSWIVRVELRKAENAAIKIQCMSRSVQAKRSLKQRSCAIIIIQKYARSWKARKDLREAEMAVAKMQRLSRCFLFKRDLERRRRARHEKLQLQARHMEQSDESVSKLFLVLAALIIAFMLASSTRTGSRLLMKDITPDLPRQRFQTRFHAGHHRHRRTVHRSPKETPQKKKKGLRRLFQLLKGIKKIRISRYPGPKAK